MFTGYNPRNFVDLNIGRIVIKTKNMKTLAEKIKDKYDWDITGMEPYEDEDTDNTNEITITLASGTDLFIVTHIETGEFFTLNQTEIKETVKIGVEQIEAGTLIIDYAKRYFGISL